MKIPFVVILILLGIGNSAGGAHTLRHHVTFRFLGYPMSKIPRNPMLKEKPKKWSSSPHRKELASCPRPHQHKRQ